MVRHEPRPAWCGSSCRQGARQAVKPELFNISATFCPRISHGLYALHADMKANPKLHLAMDLNVIGKANEVCAAVRPPLPLTHVCVHPPETDRIISKGIVWRGHWASDCNEEYAPAHALCNCECSALLRRAAAPRVGPRRRREHRHLHVAARRRRGECRRLRGGSRQRGIAQRQSGRTAAPGRSWPHWHRG